MDRRHLTGGGRFTADLRPAGAAAMAVLRSPVAHGRLLGLDLSEAREIAGVLDILTIAELDAEGIGPLPCRTAVSSSDGSPMAQPPRPVLARERLLFVGQPVVAVIADTPDAARDAVEAIAVDIEDLPPVLDPETAELAGPIHPEAPSNTAFFWEKGNREETRHALSEAPHLVTLRVVHPRVAIQPMETRAVLASFGQKGWEVRTPSQGAFGIRTTIAECLSVEPDRVRVRTPDTGGSFAAKIWTYPEHILACVAARRIGRPVFWEADRGESLLTDAAGRGRVDQAALALDRDGRFLGFRIDAIGDLGAWPHEVGPYTFTTGAVRPFGQCYDIPAQHYRVTGVYTNQVPTDAYRGAGKPESAATLERIIDLAARRLGIDPFELRRRNLIRPEQIPYATPMGETIDSGDYPALAERLHLAADWDGVAGRKARARGFRGAAVGFHQHATGGSVAERVTVEARGDGTVLVRTGTQDSGQGHAETLAVLVAEVLEIDAGAIMVEQGDTGWMEKAGGTGGSSLVSIAGTTVHKATRDMLEAARALASEALEAACGDIVYGKGRFSVAGTDRGVTLFDLAEAQGGCAAQRDYEGTHTTFPAGGYAVEVEIDPETGAVRIDRFTGVTDAGRIVHMPGALGQLHGGITQGLGEALLEAMAVDGTGQVLTGSLMDYALPRADAMPRPVLGFLETDSPHSIIGAKGIGELPSIGAPAVFVNAVIDALAMFGVEHLDKPVTSEKIWRAITGRK